MSDTTERLPDSLAERLRMAGLICLPPLAVLFAIVAAKFGVFVTAGAILAAGFGVAALYRPDFATCLFAGLIYANAPAVAVKFNGVPKIAAGAVFGLLLLPLAYHMLIRKQKLIVSPIMPLLFCFIVLQFISSVFAQRMHVSTPVIITSLIEGLVLFGLITNVVRTPEVLTRTVWSLLIVGGILGALSLFQYLTDTFDRNYGGFAQISMIERNGERMLAPNPRSVGSVGEKNYYAQFMLFLVPLGLLISQRKDALAIRSVAYGSSVLALIAVGLTASRGAAVGFIVLLGGLYFLRVFKLKQVVIILAVAVMFVGISEGFRERVVDLWNASSMVQSGGDVREVDKSLQGRASEMLAAAIVFQRNPVIGVGAGNFPYHFARNSDALGFSIHDEERLAHCSYLEVAAETGLFGLMIFLSFFYFTITGLVKARRVTNCPKCHAISTAFLLTVVVMMVTSVFLSFAYVRYYWLILALASCASRISIERQNSTNEVLPEATA